jgi:carbon-monoxide dehydrogenase medium subunit
LKPPPFEYHAPTTVDDALDLIASKDNARLLAGGQSLMAMMNMRFVIPDHLIDLNPVAELNFVRAEGDEVVIGAMTRQRELQRLAIVKDKLPLLPRALVHVGHPPTRNRGTIGGSLCQLDPSAELPAIARAYDATLEVKGRNGLRKLAFESFPAGYMTPALGADEILVSVRFTPWSGRVGYGFREFARRHGDFAIAGAAVLLRADSSGRMDRASLTVFGIAHAPIRVTKAEAMLLGERPEAALFTAAAGCALELATLEDPYGSAEYRGHVAAAMLTDALSEAAAELEQGTKRAA